MEAIAPAFREAFKKRRCIIPADAFDEWQPTGGTRKQPYAIVSSALERRTVSLNRRGFLRRWVCDSLPGGGDLRCQKPIRLICASGS
ncbi:MAG: SOS response-associated peptidase family protein, partial [Stellaceae bacterium]